MWPSCRFACTCWQPPAAAVATTMASCPCCDLCCTRLMLTINWCSANWASKDPQRQDGGLQMLLLPPLLPAQVHLRPLCAAPKEGAGRSASGMAAGCSQAPPPCLGPSSAHTHTAWTPGSRPGTPWQAPHWLLAHQLLPPHGHDLIASGALPPAAWGHGGALGNHLLHGCVLRRPLKGYT